MTTNLDAATKAEIIETAEALADAARRTILPYFRQSSLVTDNKDETGFDPVTEADRAAELAMRDLLKIHRPQDAILGEEFGRKEGQSGLTWILDPIDGTRGFMSGTPSWGVLIGVTDENGAIFGVMDQPYVAERWIGGFGEARFEGPLGARSLKTRNTSDIADAILFSTFPEVGTEADCIAFKRVVAQAKLTRYGLDCYAYGLIALGQVDLVIEAGLASYDICAQIPIIEAAGGIVTDWEGQPVHEGGRAVAASNAELHAKTLEVLSNG